jgi:hypothetical protein
MVLVEPRIKHWNSYARRFVTLTFFFAFLPPYGGLFIEAMPDWIYRNYEDPPFLFAATLVDSLAGPLGLLSSQDAKVLAEEWMKTH